VRRDDRQQVVEIVGDAAGEPTDGLEALRLPQLFLQVLHVAAIQHEAGDADQLPVIVKRSDGILRDRQQRPVHTPDGALVAHQAAVRSQRRHRALPFVRIGIEGRRRMLDQMLGRVEPEQLGERLVARENLTAWRADIVRAERLLEQLSRLVVEARSRRRGRSDGQILGPAQVRSGTAVWPPGPASTRRASSCAPSTAVISRPEADSLQDSCAPDTCARRC
jgi:hypothetical protein